MADTARTRSTLLSTYFPDNVTGQISPQDLRDGVVTWMPAEFENPGDFWCEASSEFLTDDDGDGLDYRGYVWTSQIASANFSIGQLMMMTSNGTWAVATMMNASRLVGMALNAGADGDSDMIIFRRGIVMYTGFSALLVSGGAFVEMLGRGLYLDSMGSFLCNPVNLGSANVLIGHVAPSDGGVVLDTGASATSYCIQFNPTWGML